MHYIDDQLDLFYSDPGLFAENCSELVRSIIVYKMIVPGWFHAREKNDLYQEIFRRFLERLPSIRDHYRKEAQLSTYISRIINNICYEICRERKRQCKPGIINIEKIIINNNLNPVKNILTFNDGELKLYVSDALNRLDFILSMYNNEKPRIILMLKLYYGLPVRLKDITDYSPGWNDQSLLERIKENTLTEKPNYERYKLMSDVVNYCEGKKNHYDSIRKNLNRNLEEILSDINGNPPVYAFDKETFRYLFEKYCENFSKSLE